MFPRVALLMCGTLLLFAFGSSTGEASANEAAAGVSIVNGRTTTIAKWPWQVALTVSRKAAPNRPTSRRFFCGGAVLAPTLVVTAGHCVADLKPRQVRRLEIVSGRTRLNSNLGEVSRVVQRIMPRTPSGRLRYRTILGIADWDIALLRLATPVSAEPIRIAGPDEAASWAPGQVAWTTGWGITRGYTNKVSKTLRVATQVILTDALCRRSDGVSFRSSTMNCIGGPAGNSSTCSGDSGGPLVVKTSLGYRLVGLTSYGDNGCRGFLPSVDTRIAGNAIREWVAATALRVAGVDVIGSGGEAAPVREWCRVPEIFGLTVRQAGSKLAARGCRLGRVRVDRWGAGPSRRVIGYSRIPGWFAPLGSRVNVWISP
jgi:secreted trypsin-like serine protease